MDSEKTLSPAYDPVPLLLGGGQPAPGGGLLLRLRSDLSAGSGDDQEFASVRGFGGGSVGSGGEFDAGATHAPLFRNGSG